jgi:hypothetical protein
MLFSLSTFTEYYGMIIYGEKRRMKKEPIEAYFGIRYQKLIEGLRRAIKIIYEQPIADPHQNRCPIVLKPIPNYTVKLFK